MDKSVFQNMTVLLEIEQISNFRDERAIDDAALIVSEIAVNDKDIRQGPMDNIEAYVAREHAATKTLDSTRSTVASARTSLYTLVEEDDHGVT